MTRILVIAIPAALAIALIAWAALSLFQTISPAIQAVAS